MKKKLIYVLMGIMVFTGVAWASSAGGYNYITAEGLERRIKQGPPIILIDICPVDRFAKGHIPGSIETNAYPSKTDEETARLDKVMSKIRASSDDVVIVCPSGAGGARNTVDYYKSKGVPEKRLLILEKGMGGWPYEKESK
jgi:rhodanese-related sulfurtransferase